MRKTPAGGRCRRAAQNGKAALLLVALLLSPAALRGVSTAPNGSHTATLNLDPAVRDGFQHFYNLDYDGAIQRFSAVRQRHPDEPMATVYVLNAELFRELNRLDLLDTTLYAHEGFLTSKHTVTEDKRATVRIDGLADDAVRMANSRLREDSNDLDALFARGYARSLKATYMGLVSREFVGGLHLALQARGDHEKVLQMDPDYVDAKMVVGIHEYVVGALPFALRLVAGITGNGGNKAKGMAMLEDSGKRGVITSVESRTTLSLFLRHDGKYEQAIIVARSLREQYPRDFLFCLEEANLEKDAGNGPKAIAGYRDLLQRAQKPGYFSSAHMELAWFGLAEALRGQTQYRDAAEAYQRAVELDPAADLKYRCQLGAGEMYDLLKDRELAEKAYSAVIAENGSSPQAEQARKYLRTPYSVR